MEDNELVKEISPEEVRDIDPFEISYIAMKDGSIIMVIDKIEIQNKRNYYYQMRENREKEIQKSPNYNLKEKAYVSYIKPKMEKEPKQYEEEEDFNVYYSNNNKKRKSFQGKPYRLNINNNNDILYEDINSHKRNDSFYSTDVIHQPIYQTKNYIEPSNNEKIEYIYENNSANKEEYQNNNFNRTTNNNIKYINECTNFENQKPLFIVKKNYKYYKKTKCENSRENKTYNNKKPHKNYSNDFIRDNNNNISITESKYSIISDNDNNNEDNSINKYRYKTPEPQQHNININRFSFRNDDDKYSSDIIRERKLNKIKTTNNTNTNNNVNNYYNEIKIHKLNNNRKRINIKNAHKSGYSLEKIQSNNNYNISNEMMLENDNENIRSKTPFYSIKNLRRNTHVKKKNGK
jgi:hypothetical protein